jgi:GTP-binding protein
MIIHSAEFVKSSSLADQCPPPGMPEYAFVGRSNVGKSSLINMLTGFNKLAKTSSTPGKTQTINHFIINGEWLLADLPGYGYAKVSKRLREHWNRTTNRYILTRENLICLFVLIDSRHLPLKQDLEFMEYLGQNQVPFARVFTKADKAGLSKAESIVTAYDKKMLETWDSLPETFITSAVKKWGGNEIMDFIEKNMTNFNKP